MIFLLLSLSLFSLVGEGLCENFSSLLSAWPRLFFAFVSDFVDLDFAAFEFAAFIYIRMDFL